jgi:pantothenate kinase
MSRFYTFTITESELDFIIKYTKKSLEKAFFPLVRQIVEDFQNKGGQRYILCIAGPPGCGKSSIAKLLQILLEKQGIESQILPMDGFHLKNSVLKKKSVTIAGTETSLYSIKGAKETYSIETLVEYVQRLHRGDVFYWPTYSRTLHDPVDRGVRIDGGRYIYIVEGNYLLLLEHPWSQLQQYFDKRLFITSREFFLRPRVIRRKHMGGISRAEAHRHYRKSDRRNIREVLTNSGGYDWLLVQQGGYRYGLHL